MWLHCRYYFLSEEKALGTILSICIVMMFVLTGFLLYHFNFAVKNMTTNEAYKIPALRMDIFETTKILDERIKNCHDWKGIEKDMPSGSLGGLPLPENRKERLKYLEEKKAEGVKILEKLSNKELYEYKPKSGLFQALSDIWHQVP